MQWMRSEQGSMPIVLFLVAFAGTLSVLVLTVTAGQVQRVALAEATAQSRAALETGLAVGGDELTIAERSLCDVPGVRPADFTANLNSSGVYRWWVDKSRLDDGQVKLLTESQSGDQAGAGTQMSSLIYRWTDDRWEPVTRIGYETFPYPDTTEAGNC